MAAIMISLLIYSISLQTRSMLMNEGQIEAEFTKGSSKVISPRMLAIFGRIPGEIS
jgi:hypothetical protein